MWRRGPLTDRTAHDAQASLRAVQHQLKINPDGTPAPLTVTEWLLHGTRDRMLARRLEVVRASSRRIKEEVNEVKVPDESLRDIILVRQFILQVTRQRNAHVRMQGHTGQPPCTSSLLSPSA